MKRLQKNDFVENVWPAKSALFIYVSTHCVLSVKKLDINRYSQLTRWCRGNASALVRELPGSIPGSDKGFYVWFFCGCVFYILSKNTFFVTKFCNSFCNINTFSILNILQEMWTIIRVRYRPSIFKGYSIFQDIYVINISFKAKIMFISLQFLSYILYIKILLELFIPV